MGILISKTKAKSQTNCDLAFENYYLFKLANSMFCGPFFLIIKKYFYVILQWNLKLILSFQF